MSKKVACPTCGLYNSPFHARCQECGTSLSNLLVEDVVDNRTHKLIIEPEIEPKKEEKDTIICPYCDTLNSSSAFRCTECGNRLVQRIEVEPIIEPSSFVLKDPKGHEITVSNNEPFVLGREHIASLKQAQYISKKHVKITLQDDGVVFEDLHSTNGTWIDGTLLVPDEPTLFQDFNYIKLANVILVKTNNEG